MTILIQRTCAILAAFFTFAAFAVSGIDFDNDGIDDALDNCPDTANADQRDTDGDGFGNICDADLDNTGGVNTVDLGLFRKVYFTNDPDADFNGDGAVNILDLAIFRQLYFKAPGPVTNYWIGSTGGNWEDASRWSAGRVPDFSNDAVRIAIDADQTIVIDNFDARIRSLVCTGRIELSNSAEIDMDGDSRVDQGVTISSFSRYIARSLRTDNPDGASVIVPDGQVATLSVETLGLDLHTGNDTELNMQNVSMTLEDVSIQLNATDDSARIGAVTGILGTGEILFGGSSPNNLNAIFNTFDALTIGPNIVVRTLSAGGQIEAGTTDTLTVHAAVFSTQPDHRIVLRGGPVRLYGSVTAQNGGDLFVLSQFGPAPAELAAPLTATGGSNIDVIAGSATDQDLHILPNGVLQVDGGRLMMEATLLNEGAVSITNGELDLRISKPDTWINTGSISLVNTPALYRFRFPGTHFGSFTSDSESVFNARIVNRDADFDIQSLPGLERFDDGAGIEGGRLVGTPLIVAEDFEFTLDGVTLATNVTIRNGGELRFEDGLTLDGATVSLEADDRDTRVTARSFTLEGNTIGGTGEIVFNGSTTDDAHNQVVSESSQGGLTLGPGVTVRTGTSAGSALTSGGLRPIAFFGNLVSDLPGRTVAFGGFPAEFYGSATATNGGHLSFTGDVAHPGSSFAVSGGGSLELAGAFTAESALRLQGSVSVTDGDLSMQRGWINEGTILVTNGDMGIVSDFWPWQNDGQIEVVGGNVSVFAPTTAASFGAMQVDGSVEIFSRIDNDGQVLNLDALPDNTGFGDGSEIVGGEIVGQSLSIRSGTTVTLDGVVLSADTLIEDGGTLIALSTLTLNDNVINMDGSTQFTHLQLHSDGGQPASLLGSGEIWFGGQPLAPGFGWNNVQIDGMGAGGVVAQGVALRTTSTSGRINSSQTETLQIDGSLIADAGESIRVTSDVLTSGELSAGIGSTLSFIGALTLAPESRITLLHDGLDASARGRMQVQPPNVLTLDGALELAFTPNFAPVDGDSWSIADLSGAIFGQFGDISAPTLAPGLAVVVEPGVGELAVRIVPDANP